jgi:hypothetical protein
MRAAIILGFLLLVPACVGQTPPARAQEAANELNTNQRFGRMELVAERVSEGAREKFFERRKQWGGRIQVADTEVMGFKMKGDSAAEVMLKIGWYRVDEGDLHTTVVKQSWKDFKGAWKLVNEERTDGDSGLLGEAAEPVHTDVAVAQQNTERRAADKRRFATVRLGQADGAEPAPESEEPVPESPSAEPANSAKTAPQPAKADAPKSDAPKPSQNTKAEPPKAEPASAESARRPASGTP